MNIILKELETLVKISNLFQDVYYNWIKNTPVMLRKCNCNKEGYGDIRPDCTICDGLGLVSVEKSQAGLISIPKNTNIVINGNPDFSKFEGKYKIYTLYKTYIKQMQDYRAELYIRICESCSFSGKILTSDYKDRVPVTKTCPTCHGSLYVLCAYDSRTINDKPNTVSKGDFPTKPPFHNG
jgi:hypothetical protein